MIYHEIGDLIKKASYVPLRPVLLARIMKNYFKILFLKKKVLRYINIWATWKCQCNCDYCSNSDTRQSLKDKRLMSSKDFEKVFDSARRLGAININLVGGEPLVSEELCDLIKLAKPKTTVLSITTNGILLKDHAKQLYKAGLDRVNVSLDSPYSHIHDKIKHFPGAFEKAIAGIEAAKGLGLKVMIAMVLNHQNINNGEVEEMVLLSRKLGVDLQILPVIAIGNFSGHDDMRLDKNDMKKFYQLASSWHVRWDGRTNYFKTGCPAGVEKLTIDIFGDVFPCSVIPIRAGNIFEQSLESIFYTASSSEMFKKWSSICRSAFDDEFIKKYMPFS